MIMPQIKVENLTLGYDGVPVASNISFSVKKGDYLCIVGENGSGKTTLMKTVLGLQKPLAGQITFGDGLRQNEIGYLPQQTEYFLQGNIQIHSFGRDGYDRTAVGGHNGIDG